VISPLAHLDHHFLTAHNGDASADHDGGSAASFAARRLLLASIVYLPLAFCLLMFGK
jgi:hypothetical protein